MPAETLKEATTPSFASEAGRLFFCQAEDGIRDYKVTGVQTCALPIFVAIKFLRSFQHRRSASLLFSRALHCSTFFRAVYKTFLTHRCLQGSVATRDRTIAWVFTDGVKFVNFLGFHGAGFRLQIGRASCRERV